MILRDCWALLLYFFTVGTLVFAADPKRSLTGFENLPARLFFFEDTSVAIYHDAIAGDVYVSEDEGNSWSLAKGVPSGDALMVIEHPFNNRIAFILTNDKTHYRTDDRGKSWRSFDMPVEPAMVARPLSFHSKSDKSGYILYQGTKCERIGWGSICRDETYYTTDSFGSKPKLLRQETSRCQFAHSSADFRHESHDDLIYCVAFDTSSKTGNHDLSSSRLFSSTDFFDKDVKAEDLGIGRDAKGVVAFAIVSKFAVVALKDLSRGNKGEMLLYVSEDAKSWAKAQFPHAASAQLRENAYTIVESTKHSLAIDVVLHDQSTIGTLFFSNSNGTYFVESLKDTNRNEMGFVDYENLYGVEGVGLANVVANAEEVEGRGAEKQLRTLITFDDGASWSPVKAPSQDSEGKDIGCDTTNLKKCSLHFHSVTSPHNFGRIFSSPAPGFVMGVGSVGSSLKPYGDSDTFISTDAGVTWTMIRRDAHKYEFGDSGSILVVVNDEEPVEEIHYSTDEGRSWKKYNLDIKIRAKVLLTVPDSTSQKFMLIGQVSRQDQAKMNIKRYVIVFLDFAATRTRQCGDSDFEKFYVRTSKGKECLMGHKQWYNRRKANADCYVGKKFEDPVNHEENCECTDDDFECDYNFVLNDGKCVPVGPEHIPAGTCRGDPNDRYMGSSGYRKIPGNTCVGGLNKDKQVEKPCKEAAPEEGEIVHQAFEFPGTIVQHAYFKDSTTILVRLHDHSIWQSSNEGYTWQRLYKDRKFLVFYHHNFASDHAYLITDTRTVYYTTNYGHDWQTFEAPTMPNSFGLQLLHFHPTSDYLLWIGDAGCENNGENCHVEAHYSRENGQAWKLVEKYVRNCAWARDGQERLDPTEILCESYSDKKGDQRTFYATGNSMELVVGKQYYQHKTKLFDNVVGFTKFSEFILVAELVSQRRALNLQVSLNGEKFASGRFPPGVSPDTHAYTVLESTTKAVFLHMTTSEKPYWGHILKSNSNGTYYGLSAEYVNRDDNGYVDFEKVIGLEGIAMINVVHNPREAAITGKKTLQSRITHNDGANWKTLTPPAKDSLGREYECKETKCVLNIHSYTERRDPRATFSSPSIVGVLMAVGNVGEELKPYADSDTFLSRDAGFTWEEVHKDAHLWEFGDSGALLVMVNDEEPTDVVLFSTNEGKSWREYQFSKDRIRVTSIVTVQADTSRRFILLGHYPTKTHTVAIHVDFTQLTSRRCTFNPEHPSDDDFELWSPSEEREEACLFGKQTLYHRRARDKDCVVGDLELLDTKIVRHCQCQVSDFECEFNHVRNDKGDCVPVKNAQLLPPDDSCTNGDDFWYERTAYRKNPISACEDGLQLHHGEKHQCPGFKAHGAFFWMFMLFIPFGFTALVGYWFYRRSGMARGTIRLPGDGRSHMSDGGFIDTLASVPWFLIGLAGIAWEKTVNWVESWSARSRARHGYRNLAVDEDAQVLRFADED